MKTMIIGIVALVCIFGTFGFTYYYVSVTKNQEILELKENYELSISNLNEEISEQQSQISKLNTEIFNLTAENEYVKEWLHYDQNLEFDRLMGRWNLTQGDENIHYPVMWFRSAEFIPGSSSVKVYRNVLIDLPYPEDGIGAYFARYYIEDGEITFQRIETLYPYPFRYSYSLDNDTLHLYSDEYGTAKYERTLWYDWP